MQVKGIRRIPLEVLGGRFYYGWVVLGVCIVLFFSSGPGQSHTFSVFNPILSAELGISLTMISVAYGGATLLAAFLLPKLGRMIDVQGSFRMFLVIGSFLGFACIGFGLVGDVLSLGAVFAALRFFGQGAMMMLCATLVAQWFIDRRGLAMSLMALGFAASMALHPPLVNWLAETLGWRSAWYWLGIITWVTVLPLTLLFVHNKPEDVGLLPDGRKPSEDGDRAAQAAAEFGLTRSEALRTKSFWILAAGMFTPAMLITSLFFFQVSIFDSLGLERSLAASTFTITAVMMAVSMPLVGWTLDRLRTRYVFAAALVLLSCSLVTVTFVDGIVMAMIYGAMFGLNNAASITFFSYIWAHYFGRKHIGSVQGVGQMIGVFGASLGPLPLGLAFDMIGSYTEIIRLLAILPLACAVLAMFLKQPETASEQV